MDRLTWQPPNYYRYFTLLNQHHTQRVIKYSTKSKKKVRKRKNAWTNRRLNWRRAVLIRLPHLRRTMREQAG